MLGALGEARSNALLKGLAASHGDQLRRFLLPRVRVRADVPDIVHEVICACCAYPIGRRFARPRPMCSPSRATCCSSTSSGRRPSRIRQISPACSINPRRRPRAIPNASAAAEQCLEQLQRALDRLPAKVQAAFMLHRRDGLSFDEISQELGVSRALAKKYILTALVQLRLKLKP